MRPNKNDTSRRLKSGINTLIPRSTITSFGELEEEDDDSQQLNVDLSDMRDSLLPG